MDDMVALDVRVTDAGHRIAIASLINPSGEVISAVNAEVTHLFRNGRIPSDETIIMDIAWRSTGDVTRAMEQIVSTLIRTAPEEDTDKR